MTPQERIQLAYAAALGTGAVHSIKDFANLIGRNHSALISALGGNPKFATEKLANWCEHVLSEKGISISTANSGGENISVGANYGEQKILGHSADYDRFFDLCAEKDKQIDRLQDIIEPQQAGTLPIYATISEYCDARNVAPATRRKLLALGTHLRAYGERAGDLYTDTLTARDLERFFGYLLHTADVSQNAAACRLRQLRTLAYWHGRPNPNPFDEFRIPADIYGDPIYLTKDERDFVAMYDGLTLAQQRQRDIFVFQCHTGCRVGDLLKLTQANIKDGWLIYTPRKTTQYEPRAVEVPLTQTALSIIERYHGVDMKGRLLPFISEQKYNAAIQTVLRVCCINRPIMVFNPRTFETTPQPLYSVATSHTARKTFIQIAYTATGDKRLVASMSGHSENSQAFNRYSEVTREMKSTTLAALE